MFENDFKNLLIMFFKLPLWLKYINMEQEFPTKDFFNFPLYPIPEPTINSNPTAKIVIISEAFRTEEERIFLTKVLQSVKIDIEKVTLLILEAENKFVWADFESHNVKICIVFGRSGLGLGWQFQMPLYKVCILPNSNKVEFLFAENLFILQSDVNKKKLLWEGLKLLNMDF